MATNKSTKKATVTKKTAKKVVNNGTKKVAKKTSSKPAGKRLVQANGPNAFWVADGTILKNLEELRDAFKEMDKKVFGHHVSKNKNDFADWVEAVLKDSDCAAALRKSKTQNSCRTVVVRQLKVYTG